MTQYKYQADINTQVNSIFIIATGIVIQNIIIISLYNYAYVNTFTNYVWECVCFLTSSILYFYGTFVHFEKKNLKTLKLKKDFVTEPRIDMRSINSDTFALERSLGARLGQGGHRAAEWPGACDWNMPNSVLRKKKFWILPYKLSKF